jgi:hypothetical protein
LALRDRRIRLWSFSRGGRVCRSGRAGTETGCTTLRFGRYHTGASAYVRKGPPHVVLRVLGPVVTLSTLAVLGTGIGLIFVNSRGVLLLAHKASFIVWFAVMTVHVFGHLQHAASSSTHGT